MKLNEFKLKHIVTISTALLLLPAVSMAKPLTPEQAKILLSDYFKAVPKWYVAAGYEHSNYNYSNSTDDGNFYNYYGHSKTYRVSLTHYLSRSLILGFDFNNSKGRVNSESHLLQNGGPNAITTLQTNNQLTNSLGANLTKLYDNGLSLGASISASLTNNKLDQQQTDSAVLSNSNGSAKYNGHALSAGVDAGYVHHFQNKFSLYTNVALNYSKTRQDAYGISFNVVTPNAANTTRVEEQLGTSTSVLSASENVEIRYNPDSSQIHPFIGGGLYQIVKRTGLASVTLLGSTAPEFESGYHGYTAFGGLSIGLGQAWGLNISVNRFMVDRGYSSNGINGSLSYSF
jgi:hypothetical protein